MKLAKYRIAPGEYRLGEFLILRGGRGWWQVRDKTDDVLEDFGTLREAIRYAQGLTAAAHSKAVKPATIPIGLAQRLRF